MSGLLKRIETELKIVEVRTDQPHWNETYRNRRLMKERIEKDLQLSVADIKIVKDDFYKIKQYLNPEKPFIGLKRNAEQSLEQMQNY